LTVSRTDVRSSRAVALVSAGGAAGAAAADGFFAARVRFHSALFLEFVHVSSCVWGGVRERVCMCVFVRVCVRACVRSCLCD